MKKTNTRKLPVIILDFDGVILESVNVKTKAFGELFSFKPEHIEAIVNFHVQNGGMSRFEKIQYIYKNILKEPLKNKQYELLCNSFSELVLDGVLKSPFVQGAEDFLKYYSIKTTLFVVSATPQSELTEIIKRRDFLNYFEGIYGSPRAKYECIEEILVKTNCPKENAIFVGDSLNDYKTSQETGVPFIARVKPGDINIFKGYDRIKLIISDMDELRLYLEGL